MELQISYIDANGTYSIRNVIWERSMVCKDASKRVARMMDKDKGQERSFDLSRVNVLCVKN